MGNKSNKTKNKFQPNEILMDKKSKETMKKFQSSDKYWLPKDNNAQNPLLSDTDRKKTAVKKRAPLLQDQLDLLPISNSRNTKRYIVIDGNNVAIQ